MKPDKVEAGGLRHTALVAWIATSVEHRKINPTEVEMKARTIDHAGDPGPLEIEYWRLLRRPPVDRQRIILGRIEAVLVDVVVNLRQIFAEGSVDGVKGLRQITGDAGSRPLNVKQFAVQPHPIQRKLAQIDRMSTISARNVWMRLEPDLSSLGMIVDRQVKVPSDGIPFEDVSASVAAGNAASITDTEMHFAASAKQILGDLAA